MDEFWRWLNGVDWAWFGDAERGLGVTIALIGLASSVTVAVVSQAVAGHNTRKSLRKQFEMQANVEKTRRDQELADRKDQLERDIKRWNLDAKKSLVVELMHLQIAVIEDESWQKLSRRRTVEDSYAESLDRMRKILIEIELIAPDINHYASQSYAKLRNMIKWRDSAEGRAAARMKHQPREIKSEHWMFDIVDEARSAYRLYFAGQRVPQPGDTVDNLDETSSSHEGLGKRIKRWFNKGLEKIQSLLSMLQQRLKGVGRSKSKP